MASTFNSIAQITAEKETWKIRVRCERVWFKFMRSQPDVRTAMEICVLDEEGDKIQAIIPKWRISKLENIIKEGSFYVLENFEILPNNDEYAPTKHPYVLKFHECTSVRPSGIVNIPRYIFNFVNFSDLASNADYSLRVFDVIAEVYGMDELVKYDRDGRQMMRIKAHLRNL
ncbi:replication protein A 70 kDa DNA-binding subunit, partial [Striga asiatica]